MDAMGHVYFPERLMLLTSPLSCEVGWQKKGHLKADTTGQNAIYEQTALVCSALGYIILCCRCFYICSFIDIGVSILYIYI